MHSPSRRSNSKQDAKPIFTFDLNEDVLCNLQLDWSRLFSPLTNDQIQHEFFFLFKMAKANHPSFRKNLVILDRMMPTPENDLSPEACVVVLNVLRVFQLLGLSNDIINRHPDFKNLARLSSRKRITNFLLKHRNLFPNNAKPQKRPSTTNLWASTNTKTTRSSTSTTRSENFFTPLGSEEDSSLAADNADSTTHSTATSTRQSPAPALRGRPQVKKEYKPASQKGNRSNKAESLIDQSLRRTEQEQKGKDDAARETESYQREQIENNVLGLFEKGEPTEEAKEAPKALDDIYKPRPALIWSARAFDDAERDLYIAAAINSSTPKPSLFSRLIPDKFGMFNVRYNLGIVAASPGNIPHAVKSIIGDICDSLATIPGSLLAPLFAETEISVVTPSKLLTNVAEDKRTDAEKATDLKHGTTVATAQHVRLFETRPFGLFRHLRTEPGLEFKFSDELVSQITTHANIGVHVPSEEAHERLTRAANNVATVNVDRAHEGLPIRDGSTIYAEALHNDSQSRLLNNGLFHSGPNQSGSTPMATGSAKSILPPFHLSSPQPNSNDTGTSVWKSRGVRCLSVVVAILLGLCARTQISGMTFLWFVAFKNALRSSRQPQTLSC